MITRLESRRAAESRPQHGASVYPAYVIHYTRHTRAEWSDEVAGQVRAGSASLVSRGELVIRAAVRSFLDAAAAAAALIELQSTEELDVL